jgi:hypothetical protein
VEDERLRPIIYSMGGVWMDDPPEIGGGGVKLGTRDLLLLMEEEVERDHLFF